MKNKLGILGGGQLGMFICKAANKLNIETIVLSNSENFSARKFCNSFIIGDFNNKNIINKFLELADVFTVETENIPAQVLRTIQNSKKLFPNSNIIEISQNRLKEKNFINSLADIRTVNYKIIKNFNDLEITLKLFNNSGILKSCEMGYDGKGQYRVNLNNLKEYKNFKFKDYILEEMILFKKELSVIVCRTSNNITCYPVVENIHRNSILRETLYPAKISKYSENKAISIAKEIANKLNLIGILAVEMFLLDNEDVLVNELAPRPHNSGHWTLDYCKNNQFENLIYSIFDNRVKEPIPKENCKMVNVIGDDYKNRKNYIKNFNFHDYYKKEIKKLRKMGHYTLTN